MMVIVEYLVRDTRTGFLPGSRRQVLLGVARSLETWGHAKIVEGAPPRKKPRKVKHVKHVDATEDSGTGSTSAKS